MFTIMDVEFIVKEELAASPDSHLRTDNASITAAIQTGLEHSKTFKHLVDTINRTDGLVYIARGTCGHAAGLSAKLGPRPRQPLTPVIVLVA